MDADRFDDLARQLGTSASRRRLLRRIALLPVAGAVAALITGLGESEAAHPVDRARKRKVNQRHKARQRRAKQRNDQRQDNGKNGNDGGGQGGQGGPQCERWHQFGCYFTNGQVYCPAGTNLHGRVFRNCDLVGATLINVNLSDSILEGADLTHARLYTANLRFADLSYAKLVGADFTGTDVIGVNWVGAICPDNTRSLDHGTTCCGHFNGNNPGKGC
jgi:hypothetical protein